MLRVLMVLFMGFVLLDFFIALIFGGGNLMQRYAGLTAALIELLLLLMVSVFFFGFYFVIRENLQPYLQKIHSQQGLAMICRQCGKNLAKGWNCCPLCGSDVGNEGIKN